METSLLESSRKPYGLPLEKVGVAYGRAKMDGGFYIDVFLE